MSTVKRRFALTQVEIVKSSGRGVTGVTWDLSTSVTYGEGGPEGHNECAWTLKNVKDGNQYSAVSGEQCSTVFDLDLNDATKTLRVVIQGKEHSPTHPKPDSLPFCSKTLQLEELKTNNSWVMTAPDPPSDSVKSSYIVHFKIEGADS